MAQHISIRVPWHDSGWNGCVCNEPGYNNACLRLKMILSILVDTFFTRISMPKMQYP